MQNFQLLSNPPGCRQKKRQNYPLSTVGIFLLRKEVILEGGTFFVLSILLSGNGNVVLNLSDFFFHEFLYFIFQSLSFDLVRVESPLALVINGKKASGDLQAGIELSTFAKSD